MDARIAVAALKAAIKGRKPPKGCIHHSDRGSQYASEVYRELLVEHGLAGSMSRRANPYDNAKAESFMKTLKVEAVYLAAYETFEDVTPRIFRTSSMRSITPSDCILHSAISAPCSSRINTPCRRSNQQLDPVHPQGRTQTWVPFCGPVDRRV
jgi:transposase InsO family protein